MNKKQNVWLVKVIGLVCTLALVLGAVYVPVSLSAFALTIPVTPDETVTFGFETEEKSVEYNGGANNDRGEDGFGVASYAFKIDAVEGHTGRALGYSWNNDWGQLGGYRLNNESGIYRLDTNSTYVVKFKITIKGGPTADLLDSNGVYVRLGYGFSGALTDNKVREMKNVLSNVAVCNGNTWTLTDVSGNKTVTNGDDWYDLTYVFTTPESFSGDNSLGFFARHKKGFNVWLDDVQVTKLGTTTGVVLAKDEYSAKTTVITGKVGEEVELPELVGEEGHTFMGWYLDEDRTVSANGLKFAAGEQTVYAKWHAPVTLTFVDGFNENTYSASGYPGDAIVYPANLVDTKNNPVKFFFEGWYTSELFTEKYEEAAFGSSNLTVYARWVEKQEEFIQDFENYPYSEKAETSDYVWGVKYKNHEHFATQMEKIDDPTNSGRGKVVKFEWDPDMTYVDGDPNTYNAKDEYSYRRSGCITMGNTEFVDGMQYIMYFDYYVEEIGNQKITMAAQNIRYDQGWKYGARVDTKTHDVTSADKDGEWHTGVVVLKMSVDANAGPYIHAMFRNSTNTGAKVYLDNFRFVPVQVNEVVMTVNNGSFAPTEYIPVVKGATLNIKVPTVEGRTFKGWYTDSACTQRFTNTVVPGNNFTVYSGWNELPETFQDYPFDTTNVNLFGKTMSIVKGKGVGHGDDAAAKFVLDGDAVYSTAADGTVTYWASRAGTSDCVIRLNNTVADGEVYKVSFWYKGDEKANVNSTIKLRVANPNNNWDNGQSDTNVITVSPKQTEWQKAEFLYYCSLKKPEANGLFIRFNTTGNIKDLDQLGIAYVDEILIERIEKPFVIFDGLNGKQGEIVQGKVGEEIKLPATPKLVGRKFVGWYLDEEFTEPFTQKVFADGMGITVYAKYEYADNFTINFENVGKNRGAEADFLFTPGAMGAVAKTGYNNSTGLVFDRTVTNDWSSSSALYEDGNQVVLTNDNRYYVTFKYYVKEQLTANAFIKLKAAQIGNSYGAKPSKAEFENAGVISIEYPVPTSTEVGRWYTGAMILDTTKIFVQTDENGNEVDPTRYAAIYANVRGGGGVIVMDDITFKKLPAGHQAYVVFTGGANSVPSYVSGRIGTSFRSQLPKNPQYENHLFKNYFTYDKSHNQAVLEDKDMVFTKDTLQIETNWVRLRTVQDFERYSILMNSIPGFGPADFGYKLYDAKKEGNSADNVTSGRYSIHRLGTSPYFENIQILDEDLRICADEKFTVTMKVKVGKHFHTDGAIKLVGCKSPTYAWTASGSYHPIAVIADIADGEWHEVSYTFSSVERYLAIQTPGYVEIFIDDVVIERADPEMPVSTPPEFTEYVQALRDENGNLIDVDVSSIDVGSIIDFSLYIGGFNVVTLIIIVGGVLLIAGAVFVVLFIKKRKANKQ